MAEFSFRKSEDVNNFTHGMQVQMATALKIVDSHSQKKTKIPRQYAKFANLTKLM